MWRTWHRKCDWRNWVCSAWRRLSWIVVVMEKVEASPQGWPMTVQAETATRSTRSLLPLSRPGCKSATKPQDNKAKSVCVQEILNAVRCLPWQWLATTSAGEGVSVDPYKYGQLRTATAVAASALRKPRAGYLHIVFNKFLRSAVAEQTRGHRRRSATPPGPPPPALRPRFSQPPLLAGCPAERLRPRRTGPARRGGDGTGPARPSAQPCPPPPRPLPPRRQASPRGRAPPRGREEPLPLRSPARRWGSGRRPRSWAMRWEGPRRGRQVSGAIVWGRAPRGAGGALRRAAAPSTGAGGLGGPPAAAAGKRIAPHVSAFRRRRCLVSYFRLLAFSFPQAPAVPRACPFAEPRTRAPGRANAPGPAAAPLASRNRKDSVLAV